MNMEDVKMWLTMIASCALFMSSVFAFADTPVSPAEADKIKAALETLGCTGGKMEKETEGSGFFEVDDAKCRDGQYDIKLDKDFKVIVMSRD
jgi:hypothetical protein